MSGDHIVGCTGKRRFEKFGQAGRAAKRLNRRDQGSHVEPYHCRHCHGFHVGEDRDYRPRRRKTTTEETT